MDLAQFRERFDCVALPIYTQRAEFFLELEYEKRPVLFLGKEVVKEFGISSKKPMLVWHGRCPPFAIFPHPSGASPFWNSPANAALARDFLRKAAREVTP
jgi:hypothetical protein